MVTSRLFGFWVTLPTPSTCEAWNGTFFVFQVFLVWCWCSTLPIPSDEKNPNWVSSGRKTLYANWWNDLAGMNISTNVICIPFWKRKHLNVIPTWTCSKSKCTMVVAMSGTRTPNGVWCGLWRTYQTGHPERREISYYVNPWCWMTLRDQHVPGIPENIGNHSKAPNFSHFIDFMMFPVSTWHVNFRRVEKNLSSTRVIPWTLNFQASMPLQDHL